MKKWAEVPVTVAPYGNPDDIGSMPVSSIHGRTDVVWIQLTKATGETPFIWLIDLNGVRAIYETLGNILLDQPE